MPKKWYVAAFGVAGSIGKKLKPDQPTDVATGEASSKCRAQNGAVNEVKAPNARKARQSLSDKEKVQMAKYIAKHGDKWDKQYHSNTARWVRFQEMARSFSAVHASTANQDS